MTLSDISQATVSLIILNRAYLLSLGPFFDSFLIVHQDEVFHRSMIDCYVKKGIDWKPNLTVFNQTKCPWNALITTPPGPYLYQYAFHRCKQKLVSLATPIVSSLFNYISNGTGYVLTSFNHILNGTPLSAIANQAFNSNLARTIAQALSATASRHVWAKWEKLTQTLSVLSSSDLFQYRLANAILIPITFILCMVALSFYGDQVEPETPNRLTRRLLSHIATSSTMVLQPFLFVYSCLVYTEIPSIFSLILVLIPASSFPVVVVQNNKDANVSWVKAFITSLALFLFGLLSVFMRQTNIAYLGLFTFILIFRSYKAGLLHHLRTFFITGTVLLGPFAVLVAFLIFWQWNGGIVLGDKSNHVFTIYWMQLLYVCAYCALHDLPWMLGAAISSWIQASKLKRLANKGNTSPRVKEVIEALDGNPLSLIPKIWGVKLPKDDSALPPTMKLILCMIISLVICGTYQSSEPHIFIKSNPASLVNFILRKFEGFIPQFLRLFICTVVFGLCLFHLISRIRLHAPANLIFMIIISLPCLVTRLVQFRYFFPALVAYVFYFPFTSILFPPTTSTSPLASFRELSRLMLSKGTLEGIEVRKLITSKETPEEKVIRHAQITQIVSMFLGSVMALLIPALWQAQSKDIQLSRVLP